MKGFDPRTSFGPDIQGRRRGQQARRRGERRPPPDRRRRVRGGVPGADRAGAAGPPVHRRGAPRARPRRAGCQPHGPHRRPAAARPVGRVERRAVHRRQLAPRQRVRASRRLSRNDRSVGLVIGQGRGGGPRAAARPVADLGEQAVQGRQAGDRPGEHGLAGLCLVTVRPSNQAEQRLSSTPRTRISEWTMPSAVLRRRRGPPGGPGSRGSAGRPGRRARPGGPARGKSP
jgi:hypothetical protein